MKAPCLLKKIFLFAAAKAMKKAEKLGMKAMDRIAEHWTPGPCSRYK